MRPHEYELLVGAIRAEGFLQPVLVRDLLPPGSSAADARDPASRLYEIVDGVHRCRAARDANLSHVPAVVLPMDYPEEKARLLQIGMNRLRGELDLVAVGETLAELSELVPDLDLALSGFTEAEVDGLLAAQSPINPNDLLGDGMDAPDPADAQPEAAVFMLEIPLDSAAELKAAKKSLRRAGGKGNRDLAKGLRAALGLGDG